MTLRKKEEEEVEGEKDNKGDCHVYMALFIDYLFIILFYFILFYFILFYFILFKPQPAGWLEVNTR